MFNKTYDYPKGVTVKELRELLNNLPSDYDDKKISPAGHVQAFYVTQINVTDYGLVNLYIETPKDQRNSQYCNGLNIWGDNFPEENRLPHHWFLD